MGYQYGRKNVVFGRNPQQGSCVMYIDDTTDGALLYLVIGSAKIFAQKSGSGHAIKVKYEMPLADTKPRRLLRLVDDLYADHDKPPKQEFRGEGDYVVESSIWPEDSWEPACFTRTFGLVKLISDVVAAGNQNSRISSSKYSQRQLK